MDDDSTSTRERERGEKKEADGGQQTERKVCDCQRNIKEYLKC